MADDDRAQELFWLHTRFLDGSETHEDRMEILKLIEKACEQAEEPRPWAHTVTLVTREFDHPDPGENWDSIIGLMIDDQQVMIPSEAMLVVRPCVSGVGYRITAEFLAGKLVTKTEEEL